MTTLVQQKLPGPTVTADGYPSVRGLGPAPPWRIFVSGLLAADLCEDGAGSVRPSTRLTSGHAVATIWPQSRLTHVNCCCVFPQVRRFWRTDQVAE